MTRYSELYHEEAVKRRSAERKLKEANEQLELLRGFVRETGQSMDFLMWLAPQRGIDLETLFNEGKPR